MENIKVGDIYSLYKDTCAIIVTKITKFDGIAPGEKENCNISFKYIKSPNQFDIDYCKNHGYACPLEKWHELDPVLLKKY